MVYSFVFKGNLDFFFLFHHPLSTSPHCFSYLFHFPLKACVPWFFSTIEATALSFLLSTFYLRSLTTHVNKGIYSM